jgi:hypothetical protein
MYPNRHVRLIYLAPPMFNSTNKSQTVKRILASLFVTSVAICSASAANAQTPPVTSMHSGNVSLSCSLAKKDGTLSSTSGFTSSINSNADKGFFEIKCNSTHSLKIELLAGTKPASVDSSYVEEFKLTDAPTNYTALNTTDFVVSTPDKTGLIPTDSSGYKVNVEAQGRVTAPKLLPYGASGASSYIINVRATLTP